MVGYCAPKNHPNCVECPLFKSGKIVEDRMPDTFWSGLSIIGEMPGRHEVDHSQVFIGESGRLMDALGKSLNHESYHVTNAIRCGLPKGAKPSIADMKQAAECCRASVLHNLEWAETKQAICLGSLPMWSFMGLGRWDAQTGAMGITNMRGVCLPPEENFSYGLTCSLHPAYILRAQENLVEVLRDDLNKAYKLAKGSIDFHPIKIGDWQDVKALTDVLDEATDNDEGSVIAIDLETTGKDALLCDIKTFGFSFNEVGWSIPWNDFYGKYSDNDWAEIYDALRRMLLSDVPKVFQNKQFDIPIIERLIVPVNGVRYDTILMHHDCYPKIPHDLEAIASQYMVLEPWKTDFKGKDWTEVEQGSAFDELLRYNAIDCITTEYCYYALREEATKLGVDKLVEHDTLNGDFAIDLYRNGILIDVDLVNKLEAQYSKRIAELLLEMQTFVQKNVHDPEILGVKTLYSGYKVRVSKKNQPDYISQITATYPGLFVRSLNQSYIYVEEPTQSFIDNEITDKDVRVDVTDKNWLRKGFGFNPSSDDQLRKLLYGVLELSARKLTPSLKKSVSKDALIELTKDTEYLILHDEYNALTQIHSAYLKDIETKTTREGKQYLYDDGCVHPNWKIQQSPSGRYGTSPIVQNFTTDMLEMFIPHEGCLIIGADYATLEVRVIAALSPEPKLVEMFRQGVDIHAKHAEEMYYPALWKKAVEEGDTDLLKKLRTNGKGVTFGKNYRGGYDAVFAQVRPYRKDDPEDQLKREIQILCDAYDRNYLQIVRAASHYHNFANKQKHLRTALLGRLRKWPLGNAIPTDCANHPIQGTAADIMNLGTLRWVDSLKEVGRYNAGVWPILQVHDAMFAEVEIPFVEEELQRLQNCLSMDLDIKSPVTGEIVNMSFPAEAVMGRTVKEAKTEALAEPYKAFCEARSLKKDGWAEDHNKAVTLFTGMGLSL